jgi:uncharacterized MAPEG superfamily protein
MQPEFHVSFSFWTILAAAVLPYLTVGLAKGGASSGYDNATPRAWADKLGGWRRRAEWAHRNHFEAFPAFAAAAIVANLAHAPDDWVNPLSGGFIVFRLLYTGAYLANLASLRSIAWSCGFLCVIGLFVSGV